MKAALHSLAAGALVHIRKPTEVVMLTQPIPWAGGRKEKKEKYSPSHCLLMAVRKPISSSCSLLELRVSLHFILPTHLLFSVTMSKMICFTTALSLDNPYEFQADISGIDSQQAAMHTQPVLNINAEDSQMWTTQLPAII